MIKLKDILLEKKDKSTGQFKTKSYSNILPASNQFNVTRIKLKTRFEKPGGKLGGLDNVVLLKKMWNNIHFKGIADVIVTFNNKENANIAYEEKNEALALFIITQISKSIEVGNDKNNLIIIDQGKLGRKGNKIEVQLYIIVLNEKHTNSEFQSLPSFHWMPTGNRHKFYDFDMFLNFTKTEKLKQDNLELNDKFIQDQNILLQFIGNRTFKKGDTGEFVMYLRKLLGPSYWTQADLMAPFDDKLEAYLKKWQEENNIQQTGVWDDATYKQFSYEPVYLTSNGKKAVDKILTPVVVKSIEQKDCEAKQGYKWIKGKCVSPKEDKKKEDKKIKGDGTLENPFTGNTKEGVPPLAVDAQNGKYYKNTNAGSPDEGNIYLFKNGKYELVTPETDEEKEAREKQEKKDKEAKIKKDKEAKIIADKKWCDDHKGDGYTWNPGKQKCIPPKKDEPEEKSVPQTKEECIGPDWKWSVGKNKCVPVVKKVQPPPEEESEIDHDKVPVTKEECNANPNFTWSVVRERCVPKK